MPDTRLFDLAQKGDLGKPDVLEKEISRMMADERSWQFVEQFAEQWLDVGALQRCRYRP